MRTGQNNNNAKKIQKKKKEKKKRGSRKTKQGEKQKRKEVTTLGMPFLLVFLRIFIGKGQGSFLCCVVFFFVLFMFLICGLGFESNQT